MPRISARADGGVRLTRVRAVPARGGPGGSHQPWALIVLELAGDQIAGWNSFLDTETLFPMFGLPRQLPA